MEWIVVLQAVCIFVFSLWKTYIGPMLAAALGFSYFPMVLINVLAVLASAFLTLWLNDYLLQHHQRPPKGYSKHLRLALRYWKRYGQWGAALLAPILLSIPIFTFIAARLRTPRKTIYLRLSLFTIFWSTIFYVLALEGVVLADQWISLPDFIQH